MIRRACTTRAAFSLLELLLSLSIAALLSLTLYKSMAVCLKARTTAQTAVLPVRAATYAMDLISADLESVLPPSGQMAGAFVGLRQMGAYGNADYLDFYSIGSEGDNPRVPLRDGIRHVAYLLQSNLSPPALVRQVEWNLMPRVARDPQVEILARGVRSVRFLYFDGQYWQEEWDSTVLGDVLPFAVQIELEMETGDIDLYTGAPQTQRVLRIVPLACAKIAEETDSSGGESATSGAGGTGGAGGGGTGGGGGTR